MTWLEEAKGVLERFESEVGGAIDKAADLCAQAIAGDHLVHLFGTGHSRIAVEEMFPRYGSFPGFVPHVELSLTNYTNVTGSNGLRQAMFIERVEGFGRVIAEEARILTKDVVIVFSVSGTNAVPREFAETAKSRGAGVIAVTNTSSHGAGGPSIADIADVTVDLGVPPGDAVETVPGWGAPIGPLSTFAYTCAVNLLRIRTAQYLSQREVTLPVIAHPSLVGVEQSAQSLNDVCAEHSRRVKRQG